MVCSRCGCELLTNDSVCGVCGAPVPNTQQANPTVGAANSGIRQISPEAVQQQVQMSTGIRQIDPATVQQQVNPSMGMNNPAVTTSPNAQEVGSTVQGVNPTVVPNNMNQTIQLEAHVEPSKKKKIMLFAAIGGVLLIVIVLGIVLGTGSSAKKESEEEKKPEVAEAPPTERYKFQNFYFEIPNQYIIEDGGNYLSLLDYGNRTQTILVVQSGVSFSEIDGEALKTSLAGNGFAVQSYDNSTIGEVKWLVYKGTRMIRDKSLAAVAAIAPLGKDHVLEVHIVDILGTDPTASLSKLSEMVKTASYSGTKTYIAGEYVKAEITPNLSFNHDFLLENS